MMSLCTLALLSSAAGCIPVPSYTSPGTGASFQPDVDVNPGQVGHWLCDDYEFVRKKTEKGDVLIELNTSTVVEHSEPIPGGGREFTFHRRKGILGDEGVAKFSALVPDAAEDPVRVTTNDTSHPGVGLAGIASATTEKQECVPVPPVQVIR